MSSQSSQMSRHQRTLHSQLVKAARSAIDQLASVAAGQSGFTHDFQLRACIALARLAPALIRGNANDAPPILRNLAHPDNSPAEVQQLLDDLERSNRAA